MTKALGIGKFILKVAFVILLFAWDFVMDCVWYLICAITSNS